MVILGGSGSVSGAILGGVFVTFTVKLIEQVLQWPRQRPRAEGGLPRARSRTPCRMVIYAAHLIGLMVLRPEGPVRRARALRPALVAQEALPGGPGRSPSPPRPAWRRAPGTEALLPSAPFRRAAARRIVGREGKPAGRGSSEPRSEARHQDGSAACGPSAASAFTVPERLDLRAHRPERRGQDHGLQPHHRRLQARRGRDPLRRDRPRAAQAAARSRASASRRTFQNIRLFGAAHGARERARRLRAPAQRRTLAAACSRSPFFYARRGRR